VCVCVCVCVCVDNEEEVVEEREEDLKRIQNMKHDKKK